jgi:hypothetical protein
VLDYRSDYATGMGRYGRLDGVLLERNLASNVMAVMLSGTVSAVLQFFGNSGGSLATRLGYVSGIMAIAPIVLLAQLTTGVIEGTVRAMDGLPQGGTAILVMGGIGFRAVIHSNVSGEFAVAVPYGQYRFSGYAPPSARSDDATVRVAPLQTTRFDLVIDAAGVMHGTSPPTPTPGIWTDTTNGRLYPEAFNLQGLLLSREPSSVVEPLDFTGVSDNRLLVESQRGFSWTNTQYKFQGMDATDSWQPGFPAILPDVQALGSVVMRSGFALTASPSSGTEVNAFVAEPGASPSGAMSWHGALSTANTGSALSSTNLPASASRGSVQQADRFRWLTQDGLEIGGPLTRWADLYASARGQWASQTEPLATPGTNQGSRLLFKNVRSRIRAGAGDRFDALYSGSRIDISDGGVPAGLAALTGNRMMPSFVLPGGFRGQSETDHFDFLQAGWTHLQSAASTVGVLELRYGYSTAHLDTGTPDTGQSRIEIVGGKVTGAPPLANLAVRSRQGIEAAWQPAALRGMATRHRIVVGGGWKRSEPRNRFTTPSGMNLITANGSPAFVVKFNTPLDSRELIQSLSSYFADHLTLAPSLSLNVGAFAEFSRGSVPAQSSPAGPSTTARTLSAQPDLIGWNSLSPRVGLAWKVPRSHGVVVHGAWFRFYEPLAGRYLDFGNPNTLGGTLYQWTAANSSVPFQPAEQGKVLLRFGGPYSSISPTLRRPYADQFDISAEFSLFAGSVTSVQLFRRDDKNRIAAINTGVTTQAFTPVTILDPGPDGIPGTFDDQRLPIYAQNPATLGQDRYLLTNPPGLRMLNTGLLAQASTEWRQLTFHASFVAEKSYGPTNPGDAVYENDPGIIGALFLDPNTAIHATGRSFTDRAYIGKLQVTNRLPSAWGGVELASVAVYMDGLVFARQLLVTGSPQGPFLVATTVRGSPEGGNRAQYVLDWNLRISRQFELSAGRFTVWADILNVTNAAQRLQESDLSGPSFNLRLPVAIQPPRSVRIGFRYEF